MFHEHITIPIYALYSDHMMDVQETLHPVQLDSVAGTPCHLLLSPWNAHELIINGTSQGVIDGYWNASSATDT